MRAGNGEENVRQHDDVPAAGTVQYAFRQLRASRNLHPERGMDCNQLLLCPPCTPVCHAWWQAKQAGAHAHDLRHLINSSCTFLTSSLYCREVQKYQSSLEEHKKLQGYLRSASRFFDLARSVPPVLPPLASPQPALLDMQLAGARADEEEEKGKGKVRFNSIWVRTLCRSHMPNTYHCWVHPSSREIKKLSCVG